MNNQKIEKKTNARMRVTFKKIRNFQKGEKIEKSFDIKHTDNRVLPRVVGKREIYGDYIESGSKTKDLFLFVRNTYVTL